MSIRLIFTIFLFLFANLLNAQYYNFKRYSIEEGLPRSGIYSILQDSKGYIWIGTEGGGVCIFDGNNWIIYSIENGLSSNIIRTIFEDSNQNIWLGTEDKGAIKYDGKKFTYFTKESGISHHTIRQIVEDRQGNIWLTTLGNGINRLTFNEQKEVEITVFTTKDGLPNNKVRCAIVDNKEGLLWFGTDDGLCSYDGNRFKTYFTKNKLPNNRILTLYEDFENNIWFGTNECVVKFDRKDYRFFTTQDGLIHKRVKAIQQDLHGNFWFGTRDGISKYDGKTFRNFTQKNGLSNNRIRTIIRDRSGNLWIGTYFGGVNKFTDETFALYTIEHGLSNNQVYDVIESSNNKIWLATLEGINQMTSVENGRWETKQINADAGLLSNNTTTLTEDKYGRIWVGSDAGITIYKDKVLKKITSKNGLADDQINQIVVHQNNAYIATAKGLNILSFQDIKNPANFTVQTIKTDSGFSSNNIICIFYNPRTENIWFGTDAGLAVIKKDKKIVRIKATENHNVQCIVEDKDKTIWVGTEGQGIFVFDADNFGFIKQYNSQNTKLPSNNIHQILFHNNLLWIGTEKGVNKIKLNKNKEFEQIKHYGLKEGFKGIETNRNAICTDYKGNILFGTIKGLIKYNPYAETANARPPITHITNVRLFFEPVNWYAVHYSDYYDSLSRWFKIPHNLKLPYNLNHVSFDFIGLNYRMPQKVLYQWKLDGIDKDWSPPSSEKKITYPNLAPGEYTFHLKTCNEDNIWTESPITYNFTITPPFWQTTVFYLIVAALGIGLVILIIKIREKQLQYAKKQLERKVEIRTRELFKEKEIVLQQKEEILQQNEEISTQRDELFQKSNELKHKNQDLTDSINYAHRIQTAIMYSTETIYSVLEKSFIFYRPKDIVSGDFYWFAYHENTIFIAAADCTGHGVPGAFMSIIGHNLLDKIVNEEHITTPSKILEELDNGIVKALRQDTHNNKAQDGMDIALCKINKQTKTIEFTGALRPLYIITSKDKKTPELKIIKSCKKGIGGENFFDNFSFKNHKISYRKGDRFYIFSDGYADQFGGKKGKKFMVKTFKNTLLSFYNMPMKEQEQKLGEIIDQWRGNYEQVDDILVIGVEL